MGHQAEILGLVSHLLLLVAALAPRPQHLVDQRTVSLVDDGLADAADFPFDSDGYKAPTPAEDFIDGIGFDGRAPNAYLDSLTIGLKTGEIVEGGEVLTN